MISCRVVRESIRKDAADGGRFEYDDLGVCEFVIVPRIGEHISVPSFEWMWPDEQMQVIDIYHKPSKFGVTDHEYRTEFDDGSGARPSITIFVDHKRERKA